ncbi:DUF4129 domain-containing protein [Arthrobacter sp. JSM 101049]|uniref:DUF4129 domain-containing protein n=1 Tax=Arthrobacter sp. JSM 101049 TaxID=929097 RepID=UPI00356438EA
MDADRPGRRLPRPTAAFLLVFLASLLVVFGAATLPAMTHHSPQGLVLQVPDAAPPAVAPPSPTPQEDTSGTGDRPGDEDISRIGQTIAAVLFAVVVLFVAGLVLSLRRQGRPADPEDTDAAEDIPSEARLRAEVASALAHAETSLEDATGAQVRSRIIACWAELEHLAAARGLQRDRASTPTEQAGAMLAAFGVASPPLARLLALYERVRYDAGVPAWEPDATQVRQAGLDFARLAEEVRASARVRPRDRMRSGAEAGVGAGAGVGA